MELLAVGCKVYNNSRHSRPAGNVSLRLNTNVPLTLPFHNLTVPSLLVLYHLSGPMPLSTCMTPLIKSLCAAAAGDPGVTKLLKDSSGWPPAATPEPGTAAAPELVVFSSSKYALNSFLDHSKEGSSAYWYAMLHERSGLLRARYPATARSQS